MAAPRTEVTVQVDGRQLVLSNLEKVLYPEVGFTKAQVIDYYTRIAPVLLPHLKDRPLTMKRYPNGVDGQFFYEKNCPDHRPAWVKTAPIASESKNAVIHYCLAQDLPTLVWAANLADLEMHAALAKAKTIQRPTVVAFDLDPGAPADIRACSEVALLLREELGGLDAYAKTSGSKGMQVYVPLNLPVTYEQTTPFSKEMAERLEKAHPRLVVSKQKKELRVGKVLVDWSQNVDSKTTVCVYSLRARAHPTVSTPVTWDEVADCAAGRDKLVFETEDVLARVEKYGDLFGPVLTQKQKLPKL